MNAGPIRLQPLRQPDDPRLSDFREMKARPVARQEFASHFVVEGRRIVERLLRSPYRVRSIVLGPGRDHRWLEDHQVPCPCYAVPAETLQTVTGFHFHRGVLASADRRQPGDLGDFRRDRLSLGLLGVTDMENLGSVLRSAAAFGVRQVLLDDRTADPLSRRSTRVSMGAALGIDYVRLSDPAADLTRLANQDVAVVAATLAGGAISVREFESRGRPVVLLLGNESEGLAESIQRLASQRVRIPMPEADTAADSGRVPIDSLNVAVAAAVLMYELASRCRIP